MGFLDFFKKKKEQKLAVAKWTDFTTPNYLQYGDNVYAYIVVQQAINCIVKEIKKLQPQHIIKSENSLKAVNDHIQEILDSPNPLMTTSDFLEKITWQLYFNYNSFILPTYENNKLKALYPLQPIQVEFLQDTAEELYVEFTFPNFIKATVKYSNLIHLRYNYSVSDFMGGDKNGQPNNEALLETLRLNNSLLDGVAKALKSSYAINGIIKYNTLMDEGKTEASVKELERLLEKGENGILPIDLKAEFTQFSRNVKLIDEPTLDFIDSQILRFFGVPKAILTGDYTKAQYEAFYQKTIEPLVVCFNQAFTKALFTQRATNGWGHRIVFNHKELEFMTTNEKIQWLTLASNVGAITINEMRQIIGYPIYEDDKLGNTPIMSKNFGDALSVKDLEPNSTSEAMNE